jgi:hypothetical protein
VRRIEHLQGIVYVASSVKLPVTTQGALLHRLRLTSDGYRCLWIVVKRDRVSAYRIAVLAHELQHALEVLEDPAARDSAHIERVLRRLRPDIVGQVFETDAALAVGDRVLSELATQRPR